MKIKFRQSVCMLVVGMAGGLWSSTASADLLTYRFAGTFNQSNTLVSIGDTFSGEFTFEDSVASLPHPDSTLDTQTRAIDQTLPGTGGYMNIDSSVISTFSITFSGGSISIGNNTAYGDRYIVGLTVDSLPLPNGSAWGGVQFDFQDSISGGADMLTSDHYSTLPDIFKAHYAGGRFMSNDPVNSQTFFTATSFEAIPEPSSMLLMGLAGGAGFFIRRRMRR